MRNSHLPQREFLIKWKMGSYFKGTILNRGQASTTRGWEASVRSYRPPHATTDPRKWLAALVKPSQYRGLEGAWGWGWGGDGREVFWAGLGGKGGRWYCGWAEGRRWGQDLVLMPNPIPISRLPVAVLAAHIFAIDWRGTDPSSTITLLGDYPS